MNLHWSIGCALAAVLCVVSISCGSSEVDVSLDGLIHGEDSLLAADLCGNLADLSREYSSEDPDAIAVRDRAVVLRDWFVNDDSPISADAAFVASWYVDSLSVISGSTSSAPQYRDAVKLSETIQRLDAAAAEKCGFEVIDP